MCEELKSCPCCGGSNIVFAEYTNNKGVIICRDCNLKLVAYGDHTGGWRKNATEKWNARAERTCRLGEEVHPITKLLNGYDYCTWRLCSECNGAMPEFSNYCLNCGAKVVE